MSGTFTAQPFAEGFLPSGGASAIYTVPGATVAYVKSLWFYNTNAATQTIVFTLNTDGTDRAWQRGVFATLEFGNCLDDGDTLELAAGDIIKATTTTGSAVTFVIAGVLET